MRYKKKYNIENYNNDTDLLRIRTRNSAKLIDQRSRCVFTCSQFQYRSVTDGQADRQTDGHA